VLLLPRADRDQSDSADQTDSADDRWKINALLFAMLDFQRTELRIFFLLVPVQTSPGEADDADDDEKNADDSSWFHARDATAAAGRRSIG
jgi:hypothetical protein